MVPLTFDLVLVGFGHVARRLVALLDATRDRLAREGLAWRIVGIATARHGTAYDPDGLPAARAADAVASGASLAALFGEPIGGNPAPTELIRRAVGSRRAPAAVTVLIETTVLDIRTGRPAADHVRAALEAGAHVVTANKGPVACAYRPLRDLAAERGLAFLFEGAVLDGIPVFSLVRETLPGVEITAFRGVVNSTTNHILCEMERGRTLADALADARAAGVAEADASLDVDGWDAAAKTAALANVLMHADMGPADVQRLGIADIAVADVRTAIARRERIKLIASARRRDGGIDARVAPACVPAASLLGSLNGMENALEIETDLAGRIAIAELTPGLTATAYALLADLVTIARRLRSRPEDPPRRSP